MQCSSRSFRVTLTCWCENPSIASARYHQLRGVAAGVGPKRSRLSFGGARALRWFDVVHSAVTGDAERETAALGFVVLCGAAPLRAFVFWFRAVPALFREQRRAEIQKRPLQDIAASI